MPEIRPITDFYDPTKAFDTATRYLQGQQHLALQNQQLQQQQANQEIDNLRQGAQLAITENPPGAAPAYNRYAKAIGAPEVTDSNAFAANPKPFWDQLNFPPDSEEWKKASATIDNMGVTTRKRSEAEFNRQGMLEGAGEVLTAAGLPATPGTKSFLFQSEQMQREVSQAIADPSKQAVAAMNKQIMAEQAGINAELRPLLDMNIDAGNAVEELAKITPEITKIQAQYEKDKPSKGITAAAGARRDALLTNPDLAAYMERSTQSVPQIEQALAQVKQQLSETTKDAHHSLAGTKPQTTDDSLHTSVGSMNALKLQKQYLESALALAKDPTNPAKHAAVNQVVKTMDARAGELYQQRTALDVRRDAQQETARKAAFAEEYDRRVGLAQQEALKGGNKSKVAEIAAKYSDKQFQVKPTDVLGAFKDPNAPATKIDIGDKTADQEYIRETRVTYNQLKQTQPLLDNIEKVKELIPKAKGFMGTGGEPLLEAAKFLNNRLGMSINVEGVKGAEEIRTRIFFNLMDNLKKVDAQPSQMQQLIMQDSLGRLGTDPAALGNMLDAYGDALRSKVEIHNEDVTDAMKQGTHFPYNPVIKLKPRGAATAIAEPSPSTPNVPHISSDAEYRALPPGTTYIAPDGSTRKKK